MTHNETKLIIFDISTLLDNSIVYNAFSKFSIPPGTAVCSIDELLSASYAFLPKSILGVYRVIVREAVLRMPSPQEACWVECWNNRALEGSNDVDYHVDNDERLRKQSGILSVPNWGLIYHVGPQSLTEGGGNWFNTARGSYRSDPHLFVRPRFEDIVSPMGRLVEFKPGRIILFDGCYAHCVEPFLALSDPRVTILVNFWAGALPPGGGVNNTCLSLADGT